MDDRLRSKIIKLINVHKLVVQHVLRARNKATWRLIRRSRQNLQMMEKASFDVFKEMVMFGTAMAITNVVPRIRTCGRMKRNSEWWDIEVLGNYTDDQWLNDFRMSRRTFFELVDLVRDKLTMADNALDGFDPERKVGVAVYKLASNSDYRLVGDKFGVSKSSVCVCLHSFCVALIATQNQNLLAWPKMEECENIARGFEEMYKLPNVIGSVGVVHVPVTPLDIDFEDYRNISGFGSIAVQTVVDNNMIFRHVSAENCGSFSNEFIFKNSDLYRSSDRIAPKTHRIIDGMIDSTGQPVNYQLPYYLIGDPSFPLLEWLMTDYTPETNDDQISFNWYLTNARAILDDAFMRLRGRWRMTAEKATIAVHKMTKIMVACCILHNFTEIKGQHFLDEWTVAREDLELQYPQPPPLLQLGDKSDPTGKLVRDHLCAYMARHYQLLEWED